MWAMRVVARAPGTGAIRFEVAITDGIWLSFAVIPDRYLGDQRVQPFADASVREG